MATRFLLHFLFTRSTHSDRGLSAVTACFACGSEELCTCSHPDGSNCACPTAQPCPAKLKCTRHHVECESCLNKYLVEHHHILLSIEHYR
ncbi:hypothetical protein GYH30_019957 [Glycine max]|uniref:Bowman-Birk serine protease inhibitors family domain-containing protein n=1 Tax=Glycine max TaxID=3847 RepID=A0A0R0IMW2_SOYBN|nr:hypothetical protein GYH30_019957 [Glycine max]